MPKEKIIEDTFIKIDKVTGKIIKSWGSNLFIMPHGLEIDKEDNIWITDVGLHQVIKYDSNGNELMVLGKEYTPGKDSLHFNLPTDIAVSENGSFYVSDGYGNSRIIKFSSKGKYLFEWGVFGENKNEFNIPHGLDLDKNGNVYVADRENNKIQKFDSLGNFITEWKNEMIGQLYSININVDLNRDWSFSAGNDLIYGRLIPEIYEDNLFFINTSSILRIFPNFFDNISILLIKLACAYKDLEFIVAAKIRPFLS